ncbi:ComF family protein [Marinomonas spartinae]|nr:ComF family protein [Marinomonas spartinae]
MAILMDWLQLSTSFLSRVYYSIFSNQCSICQAHSKAAICEYCKTGLEYNHHACAVCQRPLPQQQMAQNASQSLCDKCQATPPPYYRCLAPLRYEGTTRVLIQNIKFHQQAHFIQPLMEIVRDYLIAYYSHTTPWPSQLLFVPSHPQRIKERGFCQTQIMANTLCSLLKPTLTSSTPYIASRNPIQKSIHTQAQHTLSRKLRMQNQQGVYQIQEPIEEHVALFDDVMTTGSTLESCAKALQRKGAKRIDIWVIARTPDEKHG